MRIPGYELHEEIGRGGSGVVYRGRATDGRVVAVKVLRAPSAEKRAFFAREARLLAALGAVEGFVPFLDSGETGDACYVVMPLLEGGTLRRRLRAGALGVEATLALGRTLAAALAHAHRRGIVHRDLKPENVLFDRLGRPLVADLGLAKHFDGDAPGASQSVDLSGVGSFKGTAGYMAPEQIRDASRVGPPADVFALGAILFECLGGSPAFQGSTPLELMIAVAAGRHDRVPEGVPPWLADVIERSLSLSPAARPADGAALLAALTRSTRRRAGVAAAATALLLVGAGAYALGRARTSELPPPIAPPVPASAPLPSPAPAVASSRPLGWRYSVDDEGLLEIGYRMQMESRMLSAEGTRHLALRYSVTSVQGDLATLACQLVRLRVGVQTGMSNYPGSMRDLMAPMDYDSARAGDLPSPFTRAIGGTFTFCLSLATGAVTRVAGARSVQERITRDVSPSSSAARRYRLGEFDSDAALQRLLDHVLRLLPDGGAVGGDVWEVDAKESPMDSSSSNRFPPVKLLAQSRAAPEGGAAVALSGVALAERRRELSGTATFSPRGLASLRLREEARGASETITVEYFLADR